MGLLVKIRIRVKQLLNLRLGDLDFAVLSLVGRQNLIAIDHFGYHVGDSTNTGETIGKSTMIPKCFLSIVMQTSESQRIMT